MSNFERKFGKYAIPNLTLLLILGYAVGYIINAINSDFLFYLLLDPYKILHGQVWRIFTWLLIPPNESNFLFVLLMLYCCYSIGTMLERTWGTYRYNIYIFGGILFTVIASFLGYLVLVIANGAEAVAICESIDQYQVAWWGAFSTYYINVSIYMGFAMTYPDTMVRLFFLIPIKMKWLGYMDLAYMVYLLVVGSALTRFAVAAALLNCFLFWLFYIKRVRNPKQVIRYSQFKRAAQQNTAAKAGSIHKCSVCGRTEKTDPTMEFRYCSKCVGNYEYCTEHLFTHVHKNAKTPNGSGSNE